MDQSLRLYLEKNNSSTFEVYITHKGGGGATRPPGKRTGQFLNADASKYGGLHNTKTKGTGIRMILRRCRKEKAAAGLTSPVILKKKDSQHCRFT